MKPNQKQAAENPIVHIVEAFAAGATELFVKHSTEVLTMLENAEDKKAKVGFIACIDCSHAVPKLTVKLAWSEQHKDEVSRDLDVDQMKLFSE